MIDLERKLSHHGNFKKRVTAHARGMDEGGLLHSQLDGVQQEEVKSHTLSWDVL